MASAWETARSSIQEKLDALLERITEAQDAGEPVSLSWLNSERRYRELIEQVDTELASLTETILPKLTEAQSDGITLSVDAAKQLTTAALGPAPEGVEVAWNRLPKATVEALVGYASDGSPLRVLLDEFGLDASRQIRGVLIAGVSRGAGAAQMTRELKTLVGDGKDPGNLKGRAETIVRTEFHRASRAAQLGSYGQNADLFEGWVWTAALDGRTCTSCWAMHGTLHPLTEMLDDHPNGRCVMTPRTKSWDELTGEGGYEDTRPVIEDGSARFARLTPERQKEVLGAGLYDLYAAGTVTLPELVRQDSNPRWGTMRRPATLTEVTGN
jgi:SPP1 gp7 family putative phage head morphogenesis protein